MIWLLRHGEAAGDADDDAARPLTEKGHAQARAAGEAMAKLGVTIDVCITSPKVRAAETARGAAAALGCPVEETEALRSGDFDPAELAAGRGEVLLVGHEPDFSRAVGLATGSRIKLKKGGLAAIEGGILHHLLTPAELAAIAGD